MEHDNKLEKAYEKNELPIGKKPKRVGKFFGKRFLLKKTARRVVTVFLAIAVGLTSFNFYQKVDAAGSLSKVVAWDKSPGDGFEMQNDIIYKVKKSMTIGSPNSGTNGLKVAPGAKPVLYIPEFVTLSVQGRNGSGTNPGYAAIYVDAQSSIVITGGGTLNVFGGNAGNSTDGSNGSNGFFCKNCAYDPVTDEWPLWWQGDGGSGGNGGGGAGAGIGSNGGIGGKGADSTRGKTYRPQYYDGKDGQNGAANGVVGSSGSAGSEGENAGTVYTIGATNFQGRGGLAGNIGDGGSLGSNFLVEGSWGENLAMLSGGGGGGGGGSTLPAKIIGAGTGGAGGGGSGSSGGSEWFNLIQGVNYQPGKGGGAGAGGLNGMGGEYDKYSDCIQREGGPGGSRGNYGTTGLLHSSQSVIGDRNADVSIDTLNYLQYESTFDSTGAEVEGTTSLTQTLGVQDYRKLVVPDRIGYDFLGYFAEPEGAGVKYYNANGQAIHEWDFAEDKTLYAHWKRTIFTYNTPDPITKEGITSTVTMTPPTQAKYGTQVNAKVTLSGVAEKSGVHLISLTSKYVKPDAGPPEVKEDGIKEPFKVSIVVSLPKGGVTTATNTSSFTVPEYDITNITLTHEVISTPDIFNQTTVYTGAPILFNISKVWPNIEIGELTYRKNQAGEVATNVAPTNTGEYEVFIPLEVNDPVTGAKAETIIITKSLTITPLVLEWDPIDELDPTDLKAKSKPYDGDQAAEVSGKVKVKGILPVDTNKVNLLNENRKKGNFENPAAGKNKIVFVDVADVRLTGTSAGNYALPKEQPEVRADIFGLAPFIDYKAKLTTKVYNEQVQPVGDVIDFGDINVHSIILDGVDEVNVKYTYYTDALCASQTQIKEDGALVDGGAPANAGEYWIKATYTPGIDQKQYTETTTTEEVKYVIEPKPIEDKVLVEWKTPQAGYTIEGENLSHEFNNKELKPKVIVHTDDSKKKELVADTDYTIEYKDNKNAGLSSDATPPTAIITLNNDYSGVINKEFTITKATYDLSNIIMSDQTVNFDKQKHGLEIDDIYLLLNIDTDLKVEYHYTGIAGDGTGYVSNDAPSKEGTYNVEAIITSDSKNYVFEAGDDGATDKEILNAVLVIQYVNREITFDFAGGTTAGNVGKETWTDAHQYTLMKDHGNGLPAPTRAGYDLIGWNNFGIFYADETLGNVEILENNQYVAVWEAKQMTVTFDANGGAFDDTTPDDKLYMMQKFETELEFKHVSIPKKVDCEFIGWSLDENATVPITDLKFKFDSEKTYYAVWNTAKYDVKLHYNGGNVGTAMFEDKVVEHGKAIGSPIAEPTYPGRTFLGWIDLAAATRAINTSDLEKVIPNADKVYIAQWDGATIPITFKGFNKGTDEVTYETPVLPDGVSAIEPVIIPEIAEQFLHWEVTASNDPAIKIKDTFTSEVLLTLKINNSVTFTAVFTDKVYNVEFLADGGQVEKGELKQQIIHGEPAVPPVLSKLNSILTGWLNMSTGVVLEPNDVELKGIITDTNYMAQWETDMKKISFDARGGEPTLRTFELAKGSKFDIDKISHPVSKGERFIGWASSEKLAILGVANAIGEQEVVEDKTYYAVYSKEKSTVKFQDEKGKELFTKDILNGSPISDGYPDQPMAPTKATATFVGWTMDGDVTPLKWKDIKDKVVEETHTFTAVYKEKEFTLHFELQGGSEGPKDIIGISTDKVVLSEYAKPTPPDGYIFVDWFDEPIGGYKISEHTLSEDLTVYAQYKPGEATYNVSYQIQNLEEDGFDQVATNMFDGMAETLPASHEIKLTGVTLDPTLTSYQLGVDGEKSLTPMNIKGDGSLIVTYYFTRNDYLVSYSSSGADEYETPPEFDENFKYGEKVTVQPKQELEGYGFEGWYAQGVIITQEIIKDKDDKDITVDTFIMPAADVEINAVWTPGLYTVRYEIEELDGTSFVDNTKYKPGDPVTFLKDEPEKAGYEFDHWSYLDQPFDLEAEFEMPGKDFVLKAVWKKVDYTVGFENDDQLIYEEVKMLGDIVTLPSAPQRKYSVFKGWEIDGTKYPEGSEYKVADKTQVTFKAIWEVDRYEITYHLNDGSPNETGIYEKGQVNDLGLEATRPGYKFMGWYLDEALTTKAGTLAPEIHEDINLYAKWEEVIAPAPLPQTNASGNGNSVAGNKAGLTAGENVAENAKDESKESEKTATDNKSKDSTGSSEKVSEKGGWRNFVFPALTLLYAALYALLWGKKKPE